VKGRGWTTDSFLIPLFPPLLSRLVDASSGDDAAGSGEERRPEAANAVRASDSDGLSNRLRFFFSAKLQDQDFCFQPLRLSAARYE